MRQSSGRKWVPKGGERIRDSPWYHCWEFNKNTKLHNNSYICRGPRSDSYRLPDLCELVYSQSVDSVGCVLVVSLKPLYLTILSHLLSSKGFPELHIVFCYEYLHLLMHLFLSVAWWSLSDDDYARFESRNIFFLVWSILDLWAIHPLVPGFLQCQI